MNHGGGEWGCRVWQGAAVCGKRIGDEGYCAGWVYGWGRREEERLGCSDVWLGSQATRGLGADASHRGEYPAETCHLQRETSKGIRRAGTSAGHWKGTPAMILYFRLNLARSWAMVSCAHTLLRFSWCCIGG